MTEKIKNIIGYLAVLFCICYFLFQATSDETGDPSLAAGIVISIAIILLIDYVYEFLKTPENRDYTAVVLVISFFSWGWNRFFIWVNVFSIMGRDDRSVFMQWDYNNIQIFD